MPSTNIIVVYGIPNCDTVKKARAWLTAHQLIYQFHDFKKLGVPLNRLPIWIDALGWDAIINRKGTTWRQLDSSLQASAAHAESAKTLICTYPSVIKRPIVEWGSAQKNRISIGFSQTEWEQNLTTASR